jgi:hypothetical protein
MARVTLDRKGRWHVSLPGPQPAIEREPTGAVVGVDRGVTATLALSDGRLLRAPVMRNRERRRLAGLQQRLARQRKGSNRRRQTKQRIACLQQTVADRRRDWIEVQTTRLVRDHELIAVEGLNVKNMVRRPKPKPDPDQAGVFLPNGAAAKTGLNRARAHPRTGGKHPQWCWARKPPLAAQRTPPRKARACRMIAERESHDFSRGRRSTQPGRKARLAGLSCLQRRACQLGTTRTRQLVVLASGCRRHTHRNDGLGQVCCAAEVFDRDLPTSPVAGRMRVDQEAGLERGLVWALCTAPDRKCSLVTGSVRCRPRTRRHGEGSGSVEKLAYLGRSCRGRCACRGGCPCRGRCARRGRRARRGRCARRCRCAIRSLGRPCARRCPCAIRSLGRPCASREPRRRHSAERAELDLRPGHSAVFDLGRGDGTLLELLQTATARGSA